MAAGSKATFSRAIGPRFESRRGVIFSDEYSYEYSDILKEEFAIRCDLDVLREYTTVRPRVNSQRQRAYAQTLNHAVMEREDLTMMICCIHLYKTMDCILAKYRHKCVR